MRNSEGLWERRGGQSQALLGEAFALYRGEWVNALSLPDTLSRVRIGNPCRFGTKKNPTYGREWPVGIFEKGSNRNLVTLTKSFRKKLRDTVSLKFPELKKKDFPVKHGEEMVWKMFFKIFSLFFQWVENMMNSLRGTMF